MKNTFAENIVDFLKQYEPFKNVDYADLFEIASHSEIIYLEKNRMETFDFLLYVY
jgi:CBS domain-containing protein